MFELGTSLYTLCDEIISTEDRKRILSSDTRCAWIFGILSGQDQLRNPNLKQLMDVVRTQQPSTQLIEELENIRDFLDYLESLSLEEEVEDILFALDLGPETVQQVIKRNGLLDTGTEILDSGPQLPLVVRRTLLSCKGTWSPTAFAHVRRYPELLSGADVNSKSSTQQISADFVTLPQAQRLRRFFGIRHATPVLPLPDPPRPDTATEPLVVRDFNKAPVDASSVLDPVPGREEALEPKLKPDSPVTPSRQTESEQVRNTVQDVINTYEMRLGVISKELVLSKTKENGTSLTLQRLESMVERLDGMFDLHDDWLGRTEPNKDGRRLFIEELAAKVFSVMDQLPVDILHAQLSRGNPTYQRLTTGAVRSYFDKHPNFKVDGEMVRLARNVRYTPGKELETAEHSMWRSIYDTPVSLTADEISARYNGRGKLKSRERDKHLRESPIFVSLEHGYRALRQSEDLFQSIRFQTDFITSDALPITSIDDEFSTDDSEGDSFEESLDATVDPLEEPMTTGELQSALPQPRQFGSTQTEILPLRDLIRKVSNNELLIPEIQRSYVWKQPQVRDLFDSLYNGYPVGTLLVWETEERHRGKRLGSSTYMDPLRDKPVQFLLDGQQRITSIVNAIEGRGARLYFNAADDFGSFRSLASQPAFSIRSIPVTGLESETVDSILSKIKIAKSDPEYRQIREKIKHLVGILDRNITVDSLHGFDYGEATDVFIRVNSRGTKLKHAELAIANLAFRLPGTVGTEIQRLSDKLTTQGWDFSVAYIIRLITAVATQRIGYSELNAVEDSTIKEAWEKVEKAVPAWLNVLDVNLGILSEDVLAGRNSHIIPITWMALNELDDCPPDLLYWFVLSGAFSRYSGTTDTNLNQDLRMVRFEDESAFVEQLLAPIRRRRASLRIEPLDVEHAGAKSALKTLMYLGQLHLARENLFSQSGDDVISEPPSTTQIFPNRNLKLFGFDPGERWANNGGLVNTIYIDPSFETDSFIEAAKTLRPEQRYQHALPVLSTYSNNKDVQQFFGQRSRLLVDQMNDVLNALEAGNLTIRRIGKPQTAAGRGRRELDYANLPFDFPRRSMYDAIRRRIMEIDPTIREIETGVYIGFIKPKARRPFASIAKRKGVLNFAVDCKIDEIRDPKGMCRDVSNVGKHGIGDTGFSISMANQVEDAIKIIEQVMDLHF